MMFAIFSIIRYNVINLLYYSQVYREENNNFETIQNEKRDYKFSMDGVFNKSQYSSLFRDLLAYISLLKFIIS
jgi:hypothetical protein